MCLDYAKRINKIFKRNITCYKILCCKETSYYFNYISNEKCMRVSKPTYEMYSPFYGATYYFTQPNEVPHSPEIMPMYYNKKKYSVEGNAIHTFKRKKDAIEEIENNPFLSSQKTMVVKCTIPKNSSFVYKGKYGNNTAYASQKLKLNKIVYTNPHIINYKDWIKNFD